MEFFYFASFVLVVYALLHLMVHVIRAFFRAYRKYEDVDNLWQRSFMALGIALLKGIWANNGTPFSDEDW